MALVSRKKWPSKLERGDSGWKKKEGVKREEKAQKLTKVIRERGREKQRVWKKYRPSD